MDAPQLELTGLNGATSPVRGQLIFPLRLVPAHCAPPLGPGAFLVASERHFQNSILHALDHHNVNAPISELLNSLVHSNEGPRLSDPDIDRLDRALEPKNPVNTGPISAQPLIARLHGRVKHRVWWQDFPDSLFGKAMLVCNLDHTALLGVSGTRIVGLIAGKLQGEASRKYFIGICIDETSPDTELVGGGR